MVCLGRDKAVKMHFTTKLAIDMHVFQCRDLDGLTSDPVCLRVKFGDSIDVLSIFIMSKKKMSSGEARGSSLQLLRGGTISICTEIYLKRKQSKFFVQRVRLLVVY